MGRVGTAPGGTVKVTGLEQGNIRQGVTVEVRRGSRVVAQAVGTLVPTWFTTKALPTKYKNRTTEYGPDTVVVDCKAAPGWQNLSMANFIVGFISASGWYSSGDRETNPAYNCTVTGYDNVTGALTVTLTASGKSQYWVGTELIVAVKG